MKSPRVQRERLKTTKLLQRDYQMMRDMYEFYYLDFNTARIRYMKNYQDERTMRSAFNRRMRQLVDQNLVTQVPFFSERRTGISGGSNYAYMLTRSGLDLLSDWLEREVETDRRERGSMFIMHHLNVLYYCYLYSNLMDDGIIFDYFGEASSRYQRMNEKSVMKDFVKPDATILYKYDKDLIPWFIEHERNSRASKSTVLSKLANYSAYALNGYYKDHPVLTEHDAEQSPILLIYCENERVLERRIQLIAQSSLRYFDVQTGNGFAEMLFTVQANIEREPYESYYLRLNAERVSLQTINQVQRLLIAFRSAGALTIPSHYAARYDVKLDGIALKGDHAGILRYYPEHVPIETMRTEISHLCEVIESGEWSKHPNLKKAKHSDLMFVTETIEQEEQLRAYTAQIYAEKRILIHVTRHELVCRSVYGPHWYSNQSNTRTVIQLEA